MYKFKTLSDETLEAESLQGIAEQLWQMKFIPEPTLEEWMLGSAKRAKDWCGAEVSTASVEEHVQGLVDAGVLVCYSLS